MTGRLLVDIICIVIVLCVLGGCIGTLEAVFSTKTFLLMNVTILVMDLSDMVYYLFGKGGYGLSWPRALQKCMVTLGDGVRCSMWCVFLFLISVHLVGELKEYFNATWILRGLSLICILSVLSHLGCCFISNLERKFGGDWERLYRALYVLGALGILTMVLVALLITIFSIRWVGFFHFGAGFCFILLPVISVVAIFEAQSRSPSVSSVSPWGQLYILLLSMAMHMPLSCSLSLLVYFVLGQVEMGRRTQRMKVELATNRLKMAVGFVQPHFLYNTLTSIYYLCDKDPRAAKQHIGDFAFYLRGSMQGLTGQALIPLEQELEHVEHYLHLEQLRFGEEIQPCFDIRETNFMIPALCVEHLVENAVKYGLYEKEKGGTVKICSFATLLNFHVTVEDDGVGFDKKVLKGRDRSYFGLNMVEELLEVMCQGKMKISSEIGRGTKVELVIPKRVKLRIPGRGEK